MKNLFLLLCICTLSRGAHLSWFGNYRINKFIDSAKIGTRESASEERSLIGKIISLQQDSIKVNGRPCENPPIYKENRDDSRHFLDEGYRISNNLLRLPPIVRYVDAGCLRIILTDERPMMVEYDGNFFDVVKTRQN